MSADVVRLKRSAPGIRDKSVGRYLLQTLSEKLGEAFVITQLVEEAVAGYDDEL